MVYVLVNRVTIGVAGSDVAGTSGTVSDGDCLVPRDDAGIVTDPELLLVTRTAMGTSVARILGAGSSSAAGPRYSA